MKAGVGFLAGEWRHNDLGGIDFVQGHQLLEWSVVNLPANRQATLDAAHRGVDVAAVRKWLRGGRERVPAGFASLEAFDAASVRATASAARSIRMMTTCRCSTSSLLGRKEPVMGLAEHPAYAADDFQQRQRHQRMLPAHRQRLDEQLARNAETARWMGGGR